MKKQIIVQILSIVIFANCTNDITYVDVRSSHMMPNIRQGDKLLLYKNLTDLTYGDVIYYKIYYPELFADTLFDFARIVGMPSDTLVIRHRNTIIVANHPSYNHYNYKGNHDEFDMFEETLPNGRIVLITFVANNVIKKMNADVEDTTIFVPENSFFLMGDNRDNSPDSRMYGCIGRSEVIGKVVCAIPTGEGE